MYSCTSVQLSVDLYVCRVQCAGIQLCNAVGKCVLGVHVQPGYQKALEPGNIVLRQKDLCGTDKVKCFADLLHNTKCYNLRVIDTKYFIKKKWFLICIFGKL